MAHAIDGKIFITLGNGVLFGINENQQFVIRKEVRGDVKSEIELGHASEKNLDLLQLHMDTLRIHTDRS